MSDYRKGHEQWTKRDKTDRIAGRSTIGSEARANEDFGIKDQKERDNWGF